MEGDRLAEGRPARESIGVGGTAAASGAGTAAAAAAARECDKAEKEHYADRDGKEARAAVGPLGRAAKIGKAQMERREPARPLGTIEEGLRERGGTVLGRDRLRAVPLVRRLAAAERKGLRTARRQMVHHVFEVLRGRRAAGRLRFRRGWRHAGIKGCGEPGVLVDKRDLEEPGKDDLHIHTIFTN